VKSCGTKHDTGMGGGEGGQEGGDLLAKSLRNQGQTQDRTVETILLPSAQPSRRNSQHDPASMIIVEL
jgi:hypothetical protein